MGIYLLDYTLSPDRDDLLSTYGLYDKCHEDDRPDIVAMHFVELSKFSEVKPRNLATPFEKWLHLLKFAEFYRRNDQVLPAELAEEEGIAMALDAMRDALTKEEVLIHMALRDKMARDQEDSILTAREDGLEQGRKDGLEQGRKDGLEQGRRDGLEQGRKDGLEQGRRDGLEQGRKDGLVEGRKEVVRKMLAAGIDRAIALKLADLKDDDLA